MLNTILFDLDGTLIPFVQEEFIQAYFKELIRRLAPMGYDGEKLTAALWKGTKAMICNDGTHTNRQVFWELFTQELGVQALALESNLEDFYVREFDSIRSILRSQVDRRPLIERLKQKGYEVVLATNPVFPVVAVETRLSWIGLCGQDFRYVTTYENSRHSKPNPDYFRDILSHIGREPGKCLMVGNNPVDDMAALDAGLSGYLVTDFLENPEGKPIDNYPRGTFVELEAYLDSLPAIQ